MGRGSLAVVIVLALMTAVPVAQADEAATDESLVVTGLADVAAPRIDDPISGPELEDLTAVASQKGISLQAAIDRYAWNDNFALAVSRIREASPEALASAGIVDGGRSWVAFAGVAPDGALEIISNFGKSHPTVAVEVRTGLGFTAVDLEEAIPIVHYAMFDTVEVRDASTSFDFDTREITTVVALYSGVADSALDDLRAAATKRLIDSGLGSLLDSITISVVQTNLLALGSTESTPNTLEARALASARRVSWSRTLQGREALVPLDIAVTRYSTTVPLWSTRQGTRGNGVTSSGTRGPRQSRTTSMPAMPTRPR